MGEASEPGWGATVCRERRQGRQLRVGTWASAVHLLCAGHIIDVNSLTLHCVAFTCENLRFGEGK